MYNTLFTKSFNTKIKPQYFITENILIDAFENCYRNCAFSTFTYVFHNFNSEESVDKTNSGNCISLSIYIQKYLFNKYNIISFLIPATIPNKYKTNGFLDISHVSLAVPLDETIIYVLDPAFYFFNPIKIDKLKMTCSTIFSKNIYKYEESENLKDYTTIDIINSCPYISNQDIIFNKYQTIPKYTYYVKSYFIDDIDDYWYYFLTEIINPDEAISSFFIPIKKDPFITTTILDNNGACKLHTYIKITNNSLHVIDEYGKKKYYNLQELDENSIEFKNLSLNLSPFFIASLRDYIKIKQLK